MYRLFGGVKGRFVKIWERSVDCIPYNVLVSNYGLVSVALYHAATALRTCLGVHWRAHLLAAGWTPNGLLLAGVLWYVYILPFCMTAAASQHCI